MIFLPDGLPGSWVRPILNPPGEPGVPPAPPWGAPNVLVLDPPAKLGAGAPAPNWNGCCAGGAAAPPPAPNVNGAVCGVVKLALPKPNGVEGVLLGADPPPPPPKVNGAGES